MTYIKITRNYYINNFEKKIIKEIIKNVKKTNIYENYNNVYYTQKYTLKQIITFILIKIKYSLTWVKHQYTSCFRKGLGKYKSNIHKHFIRFCKYNIFTNTYEELITKYINSNKSKYIYTDSTAIINKGGKILVYFVFYYIDKIKKNKYYYGKNCNKINLCIDDKKIPLDIHFYEGKPLIIFVFQDNVYDSKILYNKLKQNNDLINKLKTIKCKILVYFVFQSKTFVADTIKSQILLDRNLLIGLKPINKIPTQDIVVLKIEVFQKNIKL